MRYENLKFQDIDIDFVNSIDKVDWQIEATNELIEITNQIREKKGYKDLVKIDCDNEVYYNFYLVCSFSIHSMEILAICNHGESDDFATYSLPMTYEEKENILFQLVKELIRVGL